MSVQTWIAGRIGNWFNPANWTAGQVPVPGDSAVINAGTASVSEPTPGPVAGVAGVSILLGGLDTGQPVTLEAVDAVFQAFSGASVINTVLTVTGGEPASSPLNATFLAKGNTSFDGQILVSAKGGGLTIDSEPDSHRQRRQLHLQQRRPAGGDGGRPGKRAHLRRPNHHQRRPDRGPGRLGHRRRRHLHRLGHRGAGERRPDDHQGQRGGHGRRRDVAEDRLRRRHGLGHPGQCRGLLRASSASFRPSPAIASISPRSRRSRRGISGQRPPASQAISNSTPGKTARARSWRRWTWS